MAGTSKDSKAQATHTAAMKIVETERSQRLLKTARLRQLRLAEQAKAEENGKNPQTK